MLKQNVFLAATRHRNAAGNLDGAIIESVVCSQDEVSARKFIGETMPAVGLVSLVGLAQLEEQAKKIREVLRGSDASWPVVIDPLL